jgi:SAM-dependent methyltransferase
VSTDIGNRIYLEDLAYVHDAGFGELARGAAPAILAALRSAGATSGTVVELGCGSGIVLAALASAGYDTVGIDSSPEMLRLAQIKAPRAELRCRSLYDGAIPDCQAVVSTGEPLNYETAGRSNRERLPALVGRIFDALTEGGLFLFDLILQLPETATQYRTWRAGEDWAVLVDASTVEPDLIARRIITFRNVGSGYRRSEETHHVRLFRREEVERLLTDSGFSVRVRDGYGEMKLPAGRLFFEARKNLNRATRSSHIV